MVFALLSSHGSSHSVELRKPLALFSHGIMVIVVKEMFFHEWGLRIRTWST